MGNVRSNHSCPIPSTSPPHPARRSPTIRTPSLPALADPSSCRIGGSSKRWLTSTANAFPNATVGSLRALAGSFGFSGDEVEKRCRLLSGGEKARLVLARMLYDPPNFLVLDEPTNHLDLATKEMLIRALADFEGTLLLVSHDRRFLGALTDRVLELEAGAAPRVYGGGYLEYVAASGHEAPGMRS